MRIPNTKPPVFYQPDSAEQSFLETNSGVVVEDIPGTTVNLAKTIGIKALNSGLVVFETKATVGGINSLVRAEIMGGLVHRAQELLVAPPEQPINSVSLGELHRAVLDQSVTV